MVHFKAASCIAAFTILSIAGVLAIRREKPEDYNCRDTQIDLDGNDTATEAAVRKYLLEYWNRPVFRHLPEKSKALINEILYRNDTDSLIVLSGYKDFTLSHSVFNSLAANDFYGLCPIAASINGSVEWADCKDGRLLLRNLKEVQLNMYSWCSAIVSESLKLTGCKRLPPIHPQRLSDCYKKGTVYELDKALHYFGKDLPCSITELLYEMYYSEHYEDRLFAALFVSSLTEPSDDFINNYQLKLVLEIQYGQIDPHDKICCCKHRRERFLEVCRSISETDFSEVYEKYANTECPPGAAYLK